VLIDDALEGNDPRTVVVLYAADMTLDPFSEEAVRQANPAFGDFQSAEETLAMAADAERMPSRENAYRNLVLNQRVEAYSPFVSRAVWAECGDPVADAFPEGTPVYGGLDLSEVADLTAFARIGQINGVWHVEPKRPLRPRELPGDHARPLDRVRVRGRVSVTSLHPRERPQDRLRPVEHEAPPALAVSRGLPGGTDRG
jgi:phage terminase large subunit-like protein